MTLDQLADRYHALEAVDKSDFQRKARILQSLWREEQGFEIGYHISPCRRRLESSLPVPPRRRKLGSRLPMPEAKTHLWNFLSDRIKDVVRKEVLDPVKSKGKLFGQPRIFNDLLSSQPLCFNLFGELQCDLDLATKVMRAVTSGRIHEVTSIDFEHSPGRGDPEFSADSSAFDIYVEFRTPVGGKGFVGIETKYHENLIGKAASHKARYDDIANEVMGCFKPESMECLKQQPLQQLWRDHLLAGILRHKQQFDDGYFLLLYPKQNLHCAAAVHAYSKCLACPDTFASLTLEALVGEIRKHTDAEWVRRVYDRYLDFGKVEAQIALTAIVA